MDFLKQHPEILLIGGLVLITAFLMSRLARRRRQQHATPHLTPQEQIERHRQARGVRGDLEDLMVEIEQMARRMSAQLEGRAQRIERLLQQADQRIAQLRALQQDPSTSTPPSPTSEASRTPGQPSQPVSQAGSRLDITIGDDTAQAPQASARQEEPSQEPDPLTRRIYELADSGQDSHAIARAVSEHVGKVELILALRHA